MTLTSSAPVVDVALVLVRLHVLLVLVCGEPDETHPVRAALVTCVDVVVRPALAVDLSRVMKPMLTLPQMLPRVKHKLP